MSNYPYCVHCGQPYSKFDPAKSTLTWLEWLEASGGCSVLSGPENRRKEALLEVLHKAWLAGEDPTEYRA